MEIRRELEALDPTTSSLSVNKLDVLTPHKISVVLLVQQYLKVTLESFKAKQTAAEYGHCFSAQSRRKFCLLLLKLIQFPDMSYKDLHNLLTSTKYELDKNHLEGFEECMHDLNTLGVENLFDLFDMQNVIDKLLSESGVSQYGIVGLYIRRTVVTLDRMSFSEMLSLYKSIKLYYERGLRSLAFSRGKDSSAPEPDEYDNILDIQTIHKDKNNFSKWSVKQAELFLAQQTALLENNDLRALSPIIMQEKINEIVNDNPLLSQAHFLSYMNSLRLRDFFNALDSLHRSFDRNPVQTFNSPESRGIQYSCLNLAVLHANFNHKEEALSSLRECVMLAQESGDVHCLEMANSWFCLLNNCRMKLSEKNNVSDQSDISAIQSFSLSIQFIVKISALCGYKPSELFGLLLKSDELNCRHSLIELVANSLAERSVLWTWYGKNDIASLYAQLLLKSRRSWALGALGNNENICQVLCCLAMWLSINGEFQICGTVLHHAKERFPLSKSWMICDSLITIQQAIYKCKWQDAMKACCQLYILEKNTGILQRAAINIAKRNLHIARHMLDQFLYRHNHSHNENDESHMDSLTLVRCHIHLAYTMIISEQYICTEIFEILYQASAIAKENYHEYEEAIVDMIFAYVLLYSMNMPQKALKTIKSCMETILTNGGIYDKAKVIFLFVKCLLASATTNEEKIKRMNESMDMINEAIDYFHKLEAYSKVKDIYIYLAKFFNDVKFYKERNKFACKFKEYDQEYPTSKEYLNVFF